MLTYLTSYLCKPEHCMSELMKKASRDAYNKKVKEKMRCIGNVFLIKREISTHESIVDAYEIFSNDVVYFYRCEKKIECEC